MLSWFALVAFAAPSFPIAGSVLDDGGMPLNGTHTATLQVFAAATGGAPLATETDTVAFSGGAFSTLLGDSVGFDASVFETVDERWVSISVDGGAPSDRVAVAWAPRAGWAANAGELDGHPASDFVQVGDPIPWSTVTGTSTVQQTTDPIDWGRITGLPSLQLTSDTIAWSRLTGVPNVQLATDNIAWSRITGAPSTGAAGSVELRSSAPSSPTSGQMYFDTTLGRLRIFDGTAWRDSGSSGGGSTFGCGADAASAGESCLTIKNACAGVTSGVYYIKPAGSTAFPAYCDMTTNGGGWTLLLSYNHATDQQAGGPNLLTTAWNTASPSENADYSRDWSSTVSNSWLAGGQAQVMLKRTGDGQHRVFGIKQWVGWNVNCNVWSGACGYTGMNMYAILSNFPFQNDYYFHSCNGPSCHDGTYEAVGVDCHATYASNYAHTSSGTLTFAGSGTSNCPSGRDPDLWGFGASSPASLRAGGWGMGTTNVAIGRVAFFAREAPVALSGCGTNSSTASTSCKTIKNNPSCNATTSGQRWIHGGGATAFPVWCDMQTDGGGWTMLLSYDHRVDALAGGPNPLAYNLNTSSPTESGDFMRDWRATLPDTLFTNNSSEIMLKRVSNSATQKFTIKQWVGFNGVCNAWNGACGYAMSFYAVVKHPDYAHDYYFHACNGPTCHDGTYEAVGVDCHADYTSNYGHTSSGGLTFAGGNRSNCPAGRDPDLWGFGASSPVSARRGSWGSAINNQDIGRVAYYFRE